MHGFSFYQKVKTHRTVISHAILATDSGVYRCAAKALLMCILNYKIPHNILTILTEHSSSHRAAMRERI